MEEKFLGRDHPDLARILNNLAELRMRQSRIEESEAIFERAMNI